MKNKLQKFYYKPLEICSKFQQIHIYYTNQLNLVAPIIVVIQNLLKTAKYLYKNHKIKLKKIIFSFLLEYTHKKFYN